MKKTDFAMIILIASISIAVAFGVISAIPGLKQSAEPVTVKTIEEYTTDLAAPNPAVFNKNAINPTVDVTIGGGKAPAEEAPSNPDTEQ